MASIFVPYSRVQVIILKIFNQGLGCTVRYCFHFLNFLSSFSVFEANEKENQLIQNQEPNPQASMTFSARLFLMSYFSD